MENKLAHNTSDSGSNLFLTGAILFANLDTAGLTEYAVKALIGGAIWMGFKLGSEWIGEKIKNRKGKAK